MRSLKCCLNVAIKTSVSVVNAELKCSLVTLSVRDEFLLLSETNQRAVPVTLTSTANANEN